MSRFPLHGFLGALLAGFLALFPGGSAADHLGRYQEVGGMTVYLGLMPAQILREHPDRYPEMDPGKIPSGKNVYHVMLALFDRASGARITDAEVEARVFPLGLAGSTKHLDATPVAGAMTYCNYFKLSATDTYVIRARIRRPGIARVSQAEFVLAPHRR